MELSKRLLAVASFVTQGNRVCDVGCDHGYVSIWLVRQKISPKAIAMDVRKGPLERAKEHILAYGLDEYIETRLSDGVEMLGENEADTLILAGMGGRLCMKILSQGSLKVQAMKEIILQPQSEVEKVRRFLRETGYRIEDEDMVLEDGKFYPVLKVVYISQKSGDKKDYFAEDKFLKSSKGKKVDITIKSAAYDKYGEHLLQKAHPVLRQFLQWEDALESRIMEELELNKRQEADGGTKERVPDRSARRKRELSENKRIRDYAIKLWQCAEDRG